MAAASAATVDNLKPQIEYTLYGAVVAAQAVMPAMRKAGARTLLFTTGGGSMSPVPALGNVNAAAAALRNGGSTCTTSWPAPACGPRMWPSTSGSVTEGLRFPTATLEQIAPLY